MADIGASREQDVAAERDSDHAGVLMIRESVSSPDVIKGKRYERADVNLGLKPLDLLGKTMDGDGP